MAWLMFTVIWCIVLRVLTSSQEMRRLLVRTVGGEGALRCRFLDMGLIPKTKVVVKKIAPMGDPIEIRLRNYELTIRKEDAKKIEVSMEETKE